MLASLYAESATKEDLNGIYQEAILFVSIFGVMGIISYIYSTKHAKEYKVKESSAKTDELVATELVVDRTLDLTKLLQEELLTQEEFDILNTHYQSKS